MNEHFAITPEQGPPLAIPLSFFVSGAIFLGVGGALILNDGAAILALPYLPRTLALVHLETLGFLATVMVGAAYQLIPVVGGAPLPRRPPAHLLLAGLIGGTASLALGFMSGAPLLLSGGAGLLVLSLCCFAALALLALLRSRVRSETVLGMRLASLALVVTALLGLALVSGRLGSWPGSAAPRVLLVHVGIALGAWVGGLTAAAAWQVVPMFYLTRPFPRPMRRTILGLIALSLIAAVLGLAAELRAALLLLALAPLSTAVLLLGPLTTAKLLWQRKRRRVGESVRFWWLSLAALLGAGLALGWALHAPEPRWQLLFGWLAIVGWAGLLVHGMLSRIVPFLVWLHGRARPSGQDLNMRALLPEARVKESWIVHGLSVLLGAAGIALGSDLLCRAAGAGLVLTSLAMLRVVLLPLLRGRAALAKPAPIG